VICEFHQRDDAYTNVNFNISSSNSLRHPRKLELQ
jgi:hypothetical protein